MSDNYDLSRFLGAQEGDYAIALSEIVSGKKCGHWMWYIFPQIAGLGRSAISRFYALKNAEEAAEYLRHPVLGERLIRICRALLALSGNDANAIFGSPDDLKLKSCMTLFCLLPGAHPVFSLVLEKFFDGEQDDRTVQIVAFG